MTISTNDLLQEARQAFSIGDIQLGSALLHKLFTQDIHHGPAWELLHRELGRSDNLEDFQRFFVGRYYPQLAVRFESQPEGDGGDGGEAQFRRVNIITKKNEVQEEKQFSLIDFPRPKTGPHPKTRRIDPEVEGSQGIESEQPGEPLPVEDDRPGFFSRIFGFLRRGSRTGQPAPGADRRPEDGDDRPASRSGLSLKDLPSGKPEKAITGPEKPLPDEESMLSRLGERKEIRLIIADDISQTRENIRKLLQFEPTVEVVAVAATGQEAIDQALTHEPDIVLMDINMPDMDGLQALKVIRTRLPATQVIMLTVQDDPGYLREALQFGARDYLIKPPTIDDLLQTIHQTHQIGLAERERLERMSAPPETAPVVEDSGVEGYAIAVYSPKGGAGTTMLAANLAVALHSNEHPAVLVDGDLQFGNVGLFFNEQAPNSVADLAPRAAALEKVDLRDIVVSHEASGLDLILAPGRPEQAERVTGEQLSGMIAFLKRIYPFVVVDTACVMDAQTAAILEASDHILLVSTQDIPAIHDIRQLYDYAPMIGVEVEKMALVLNQYHSRVNITPEQISANLKREFSAIVPLDNRTVIPSVNRGIPFMAERKGRALPIGQALNKIVEQLREKQAAGGQA